GNARELRNFIERALILGHFPGDGSSAGTACKDMPLTLAEVERQHILAVLGQCAGNKTQAARLLGVSRKTLERKCAEWGVTEA
ncbi:MAG: sigma-54-dependent Fis family transcriptional regulator, partial [Rhodocyclaceae bacterium]|nr:sigma-54-dependent Fis family transcriptional regulator [Rhodocyclaceae bacterium]